MKDIEIKVLQNKMRIVNDENVTIRMQLADPTNIKREADDEHQFVKEFTKIQKNYDVLMLQEELKQMLIENQLLKEKIEELQDKFR